MTREQRRAEIERLREKITSAQNMAAVMTTGAGATEESKECAEIGIGILLCSYEAQLAALEAEGDDDGKA